MLKYNKFPLNAWVYGLSFLLIFMLPFLYFLGCLMVYSTHEAFEHAGTFIDGYLSFSLFPKEFSLFLMLQYPILGLILSLVIYFLRLHIYCTIIERISVLFRREMDHETVN